MNSKIVLMYHCIYKESVMESGFQNKETFIYKVSQSSFELQIAEIANYCNNNDISLDNIVFTFDDGGVSIYTIIAKILDKYNIKGHFYISTKYINTPGFLSKEQIIDLHCNGHIIGSHSHTHPVNISSLSCNEIETEWKHSIEILKNIINSDINEASIPNGYGSKNVYLFASLAGIKTLFTSVPTTKGLLKNDIAIIGRYVILNTTTTKEVIKIISSSYKRQKIYIFWIVLNFTKILLGNNYNRFKFIILKIKRPQY